MDFIQDEYTGPLLLFLLFFIHAGVAAWLLVRKKRVEYASLTAAFICLMAFALVRIYAPAWKLADIRVSGILKGAAVILSIIFIGLRIRRGRQNIQELP